MPPLPSAYSALDGGKYVTWIRPVGSAARFGFEPCRMKGTTGPPYLNQIAEASNPKNEPNTTNMVCDSIADFNSNKIGDDK